MAPVQIKIKLSSNPKEERGLGFDRTKERQGTGNKDKTEYPISNTEYPTDEGKTGKSLSTNYTNEYFAVNLILLPQIKLAASASVLLVAISAIRG